jgi:hypothetical protein
MVYDHLLPRGLFRTLKLVGLQITEENESFDMILDKDAFGAIPVRVVQTASK